MSRHHLLRPSLFALLAAVAGIANAGTLQISVTDKDGKPAQDVVVLVEPATKVAPKASAAPVVVAQQDLKFSPFLTVVPVGTTLRFVNKDSYDHHVRSTPSGPLGSMPSVKNFELRLDAAQEAAASADEYKTAAPKGKKSGTSWQDVKVDQAGPIGLGCHLHSSMRGQVYVSGTPFFAKTDANGQATIDGVPDGAAEVAIWHPDQLAEQTPVRIMVTAAPVKAVGQLNFTPRRRKG
jgi:plastocyanin